MSGYSATHKSYYERNREECLARSRKQKENYIPLHRRDMKSFIRYLFGKAKIRHKQEFNLTYDDLYEQWDKQNGLCVYTKVPLNNEVNHLEAASLDQINSLIGYQRNNIQFVCAVVNRMKQEFSEEIFLKYCELITNEKQKNTQ